MSKIKQFSIMYFLLFAGINTTTSYANLYFKEIGFTGWQLSSIVITSALITIISQPLMGKIGTIVKNQVNLLKIIIIFSGIFFWIMGLNKGFAYIILLNTCFSFFHYSMQPIVANMALYFANENKKDYGKMRIFGTIGFCVSSVGFGLYGKYEAIFLVFAIISVLSLIVSFWLPKFMSNNKCAKKKISLNKREIKLIIIACIFNITYGVYFNFFGIYFTKDLGGSLGLFGLLTAISTLAEIPFLIIWKKINGNMSEEKIFMVVGIIGIIRWVLTATVTTPYLQIFVQGLHGAGFIVVLTVMTTYISKYICDENKTRSQTMYAMVTLISSKIIGGVIGGIVGDIVGYSNIFISLAVLNFLVIILCLKKQK